MSKKSFLPIHNNYTSISSSSNDTHYNQPRDIATEQYTAYQKSQIATLLIITIIRTRRSIPPMIPCFHLFFVSFICITLIRVGRNFYLINPFVYLSSPHQVSCGGHQASRLLSRKCADRFHRA